MKSQKGLSDLFLRDTQEKDPQPSTKADFETGIIKVHQLVNG